jgi:hypothetical protein
MKPKIMIIIGGALLATALVQAGLGMYFQNRGQDIVSNVLWWTAGGDALLGGVFLLVGVRKAGEGS